METCIAAIVMGCLLKKMKKKKHLLVNKEVVQTNGVCVLQVATIKGYENLAGPRHVRQWVCLDGAQLQLNLVTPSLSSFMELLVVME